MPLEFDATLKGIAKAHPLDFLGVLGSPPEGPVEVLTPDLPTVSAFSDLVFRAGAEESPNHASSINDGEVLARVLGGRLLGVAEQVLWVESVAASKDCAPPGGAAPGAGSLDNTTRPCKGFPQALFFTPR